MVESFKLECLSLYCSNMENEKNLYEYRWRFGWISKFMKRGWILYFWKWLQKNLFLINVSRIYWDEQNKLIQKEKKYIIGMTPSTIAWLDTNLPFTKKSG